MNDGLTLLLTGDDVLQEVDGDLIVGWQIDACIDCEEVVALPLALVLGSKLFGSHLLELRLVDLRLLVKVALHIA